MTTTRKISLITCLLFFIASIGAPFFAHADAKTPQGELRVAMEAGYAPFNWTQKDDRNGAVPIQGDSSFAGGYDVEIAKRIAKKMDRKLVIVKTEWDGLLPALQSGKADAVIAGMSPTAERRKEVDFSEPYYESHLVIITRKDTKYAKAQSLQDFSGAKITAQLSTFHYNVIDQIPGVNKQQAMDNFPAMRVALQAGTIDGYVGERPEGITVKSVDPELTMVEFADGKGFNTNPEDVQVSVGMRKGDPDLAQVNELLGTLSADERTKIMDQAIKNQPAADEKKADSGKKENVFVRILKQNGRLFLQGTGMTLLLAIVGTTVGTLIGLLVGMFRTLPEASTRTKRAGQKLVGWLLNAYIEIFRGTPMIVQAAVIYYGIAMAFGIDLNRTAAALFIVSINTGAYMSEIVRGGIFAVDNGQFEAAHALGMTHGQTMRKVVLPQVLRNILPATGNELVINIKDTSVLSIISVSELFFQGKSAAGTNYMFFPTYFIICVIYFVLTFTATRLLRFVEKKMDGSPNAYVQVEEVETAVEAEK